MEKETVNERMKEIMEKEKLTASSLAKELEVGDQTVRNILKGRNSPSYEVLKKILECYSWVDANWLITGKKRGISNEENLYKILEGQQKTIEGQQKTIDRLTTRLVQESPGDFGNKKISDAG